MDLLWNLPMPPLLPLLKPNLNGVVAPAAASRDCMCGTELVGATLTGVPDAGVLLGVAAAAAACKAPAAPASDGSPEDVVGVKAPDALRLLRRACSA